MEARCLSVLERENRGAPLRYIESPDHPVPDPDCGCGFYGLFEWSSVESQFANAGNRYIAGLIKGWGRVVEGERGFRAQYAKPVALYSVLHNGKPLGLGQRMRYAKWLEQLARIYEVPLERYPPDEVGR